MNSRRLALGGLAVFASATLALAGCGKSATSTPSGGGSASGSPTAGGTAGSQLAPKEAVVAAVAKLKTTSYKYTVNAAGLNGQGAADLPNKKVALTMSGTQSGVALKLDIVIIGADMWLKVDIGGNNSAISIPTQWMHVDQAKLGKTSSLGIDISGGDPTDTTGIFDGLTDVQRVDATHYTGTFDLTKATSASINADTLKKLGAKATTVPGTVTLDDQGRLASLTIDLSTIDPNVSVKNTYSDYGTTVVATAPAKSDTVEAPDAVYQMFGGG